MAKETTQRRRKTSSSHFTRKSKELSMQTDSEYESDVSSIADSSTTANSNQIVFNREQLIKRIDSLTQENRVLKVELETYKLRLKASQQEIKQLKQFDFPYY